MGLSEIGTGVAILISVGGILITYGKMVQKMKDNQEANDSRFNTEAKANNERFAEHGRMHNDHYTQQREHNQKDQEHFLDANVHVNAIERGLIMKMIDGLAKRFDDQDKMLRELLQRSKNGH